MQLIGQTVKHQVFGKGIVTDKSEGTLTVSFPAGEKRFLYPDAFSKFLILQDDEMQKEILAAIKTRKEKQKQKEKAAVAKWEKEAALRNMKISNRSQGVFDVKPENLEETLNQWQVSTGT